MAIDFKEYTEIDFKEYTEKDNEALEYKASNPYEDVKCPRCGKSLIYHAFGNSYEVKCPTNGCIHETVRGL